MSEVGYMAHRQKILHIPGIDNFTNSSKHLPYFSDHKVHLKPFNFLKNWKCTL